MGTREQRALTVQQRDDEVYTLGGPYRKPGRMITPRGVLHDIALRHPGREAVVVDVEKALLVHLHVPPLIGVAPDGGVGLAAGALPRGQIDQAEGIDTGMGDHRPPALAVERHGMAGKGQRNDFLESQRTRIEHHQRPRRDAPGRSSSEGRIQRVAVRLHLVEAGEEDGIVFLALLGLARRRLGTHLQETEIVIVTGPQRIVPRQALAPGGGAKGKCMRLSRLGRTGGARGRMNRLDRQHAPAGKCKRNGKG